jgi:pyridoxine 5-phosphate synthase
MMIDIANPYEHKKASPCPSMSTRLRLVRNTRHFGIPSVTRAADPVPASGAANGITVHPSPDERHIRASDVMELHASCCSAWPDREFNVEGNPFHNLMDCVSMTRARNLPVHQVTFVPDGEGQFTSDHGWTLAKDAERLKPADRRVQSPCFGVCVSVCSWTRSQSTHGRSARNRVC